MGCIFARLPCRSAALECVHPLDHARVLPSLHIFVENQEDRVYCEQVLADADGAQVKKLFFIYLYIML